jgi:hypothetical protein
VTKGRERQRETEGRTKRDQRERGRERQRGDQRGDQRAIKERLKSPKERERDREETERETEKKGRGKDSHLAPLPLLSSSSLLSSSLLLFTYSLQRAQYVSTQPHLWLPFTLRVEIWRSQRCGERRAVLELVSSVIQSNPTA